MGRTKTLTLEEIKTLYLPPADRFVEVDVPALSYVVLDGLGDPAGKAYQHAVTWLFAVIAPMRKIAKKKMGADFVEPPLETLYWTEGDLNLDRAPKRDWCWRAMIVLPGWVTKSMFAGAVATAVDALGEAPSNLRMERLHEGRSVQIMHKGPPTRGRDVVEKLYHDYLPAHRLATNGLYHEIYLTDPNRVAPARLRTVLRQPVREAA